MKKPHYDVTAGIILRQEQVLITLRPKGSCLGGLWEFPGGKRKDRESLETCLAREIREELGIGISVDRPFGTVSQSYPDFDITLHVFLCTHLEGDPKTIGCEDFRWVKTDELNNFSFPEADQKIIKTLVSSEGGNMVALKGLIVGMVMALVIMVPGSNHASAEDNQYLVIKKSNRIKTMLKSEAISHQEMGVPKTGQTTRYGPGDDGDLGIGISWPDPRFAGTGNGTVTDNLTGLMWTEDAQQIPGQMAWTDALTACNNLEFAGYDDWRLPNLRELLSLVDYGESNPALPNSHPFMNVQFHRYWSSTTFAGNSEFAWRVGMSHGYAGSSSKTNMHYVWPVRGF